MNYILQFLLFLIWYHISAVSTDNIGDDIETPLTRVRRGGLSMLRLGRGLQMLRLGKRSMPMLRLGRSLDTLSDDDIKYLLFSLYGSKTDNPFRRQVPLPRYGREDSELQTLVELLLQQEGLRNSPYDPDNESLRQIRLAPRPGRIRRSVDSQMQDEEEMKETKDMKDKYIKSVPLPRFGRLLGSERAIPLPRLGRQMYDYIYALEPVSEYEKDSEQNVDKRGMHMLRLGRAMNMLRLGKRPMNMLRLGRSELPQAGNDGDDKRSLSMLRLGKRLHMLRLGKRSDDKDDKKSSLTDSTSELNSEQNKRGMNMLRLGRDVQ